MTLFGDVQNNLQVDTSSIIRMCSVRGGVPFKIIDSHKPNRDDERARIEALGGSIMHWGAWRVNGQLAVSRAIGDAD